MPAPGNKYAWAVGIVMLMVLSVLLFVQTLPNSGEGSTGPERGTRLKAFAAPSALGDLEGDANVCQAKAHCNDQTGETRPASCVGEDVVNLCELREQAARAHLHLRPRRGLLPAGRPHRASEGQLPGVNFATVYFSHKDRDEIAALVEERGWTQPVAIDQDGAVANLYGVGGCPTTVFARAGGKVRGHQAGQPHRGPAARRRARSS